MTEIRFNLHHRDVHDTFMNYNHAYNINRYLEDTDHDEMISISFYQGYSTNQVYISYQMINEGGYKKLEHVKAIEMICIENYRLADFTINGQTIRLEFEEIS